MPSSSTAPFTIGTRGGHVVATYSAMASPCEILIRTADAGEARRLASLAHRETLRIEHKFSRYRDDGVVHTINHSNGGPVAVDDETSRLLRYAGQCFELSEGRFDITSGVLRRAWTFDGRETTPDRALIESLRANVGWDRVEFDGASIRLPRGMEIDLGGIGKEYAADRVADLLTAEAGHGVMVNLGGDIRVTADGEHRWTIGIEDPARDRSALGQLDLAAGGVASSGDARRFCIVNGVRLGHILDPRTGWPVADAPRSVTVVADTCTAAGFLSTLAMLHGTDAEAFLAAQDVVHHCVR
ncbi:MAG TPA: FAD:protein FMN transferase [Candidatus Krumholzibacteria bacterium]|nr:FAD:protein FMN transferase [Candidatus Krumholzibacteria bacterium]